MSARLLGESWYKAAVGTGATSVVADAIPALDVAGGGWIPGVIALVLAGIGYFRDRQKLKTIDRMLDHQLEETLADEFEARVEQAGEEEDGAE